MNKLFKMLGICLLTVALLSGCNGENTKNIKESASAPETKDDFITEAEAPALGISFEATDMNGYIVTSDVLSQSKLTMVNVWATYCNPCLNEMPGLGELTEEYNSEEFQIIGIISDVMEGEEQELAESLIEQTGANYTHLLLNESLYYTLLTNVSAVPTTFFMDQNGTILDTVVGAMEKSAWEEKINALLEEM